MEKAVQYPRLWRNLKSNQKFRVMPWWETLDGDKPAQVDELGQMVTEVAGRPCKFGIIVQVGYLLETERGIWVGVGPAAADQFEDLGEWKKPKKPKYSKTKAEARK